MMSFTGVFRSWSVVLLWTGITGVISDHRPDGSMEGPVFTLEPPSEAIFLNTQGISISCTAFGRPAPALEWIYVDNDKRQVVEDVPNILTVLANNTLYFHPFVEEQFRTDVHHAKMRCQATNSLGTIISSSVTIKAVIVSDYSVYNIKVEDVYVMLGGVGILICKVNPPHTKQMITITGWQRGSQYINTTTDNNTNGRYMEFSTGSLHIYNIKEEDSHFQYRCITLNQVTKQVLYSDPASIYVIDPVNTKPEIIAYTTSLELDLGQEAIVPCAADGYPLPTFRYFHNDKIIDTVGERLALQFGNLVINDVREDDGGSYTCRAVNRLGIADVTTLLKVKATLKTTINPTRQIVDSDKEASLECNIIGFPVEKITWYKDGSIISDHFDNGNIVIHDKTVLTVSNMHKRHEGIYQCFVSNEWQTVQASAELILGAAKPTIASIVEDVFVKPGGDVSLHCTGSGNPLPNITWHLDGNDIISQGKFRVTTMTKENGVVTSSLNITSIDVEHGGKYTCFVTNKEGQTSSTAHVYVYGIPFIKEFTPITSVAHSNLTLSCHVSGYPVTEINWMRDGQSMPLNHRHRVSNDGTLQITDVIKEDSGKYICDARNSQQQGMQRTVTVNVLVPPKIDSFQFGPKKVGDRVSVSCVVSSGDLPLKFMWKKDEKDMPSDLGIIIQKSGSFSSLLSISKASTQHTGNYTCICINKAANSSYTSHLAINVPPRWIVEPQKSSVILSQSENVDCIAYGIPIPQITWMRVLTSGKYIPVPRITQGTGNTGVVQRPNGSLSIREAKESDRGSYLCQATNGIGSTLSKVISFTVHVPAYFPVKHKNYTVRKGDKITLDCVARGDQPLPISWSFNNQQIQWTAITRMNRSENLLAGGKKAMLTITHTTESDSGFYACNTINALGSDSMLIHLLVQEPPEPPGRVKVIQFTARTAKISWSPMYDGNSPILYYTVIYQPMLGLDEPRTTEVASNQSSVVLDKLYPATMYHLAMITTNNIGNSSKSDAIAFTTREAAPSGPPVNVQGYAMSSTAIQVIWEIPDIKESNGLLKGYYISYKKHNSDMSYMSISKTTNNGSFDHINLVGLEKFTEYNINVQAYNGEGVGPKSDDIQVYTKEDVPEAAPDTLEAIALTSQSVSVVWSPPALTKLNGILQGYSVYYSLVIDGEVQEELKVNISKLSVVLSHLHKHSVYSVQVCAYTRVGEGAKSNPVLVLTKQDIPDKPAGIKALSVDSKTILVSWRPPLNSNGIIVNYKLYIVDTSATIKDEETYEMDPKEQSFLIHNLTTNHIYRFKLTASTVIGESEYTRHVQATPKDEAAARIASFPVRFIKAVYSAVLFPCISVGKPHISTSWTMHDGGVLKDRSIVYINGSLELRNITKTDAGIYKCIVDNGIGTDEIHHSLVVLAPPDPPEIYLMSTSQTMISVGWNIHGNKYIKLKGFTIKFRHGHKQWKMHEVGATERNLTLTHLQCGSLYYIKLSAHNKLGTSYNSNILQIKTNGSAPSVTSEKALLSHINSTFVILNLNVWHSGSCPIDYFNIDILDWGRNTWSRVEHQITPNIGIYRLSVQPQTWYTVKVIAHNPAGYTQTLVKFATRTLRGATIAPVFYNHNEDNTEDPNYTYYYLMIVVTALVVIIAVAAVWIGLHYRHKHLLATKGKRSGQIITDNNTDISLLQETDKDNNDTSFQSSSNDNTQYTATPTRQLNVNDLTSLMGSTSIVNKTPVIYERRTILFSSSNESFQSEKDGKINPYATFGPVKDDEDEGTPLQIKIRHGCQEDPSTSYANTCNVQAEDDGYMSPKRKQTSASGEPNNEETKPLML